MKQFIAKSKKVLTELFLTREGITAWIIVNVLFSTPFMVPIIYGFIIQDATYYTIGASAYAFMWAMPMEIITPIVAYLIMRLLWKKK